MLTNEDLAEFVKKIDLWWSTNPLATLNLPGVRWFYSFYKNDFFSFLEIWESFLKTSADPMPEEEFECLLSELVKNTGLSAQQVIWAIKYKKDPEWLNEWNRSRERVAIMLEEFRAKK